MKEGDSVKTKKPLGEWWSGTEEVLDMKIAKIYPNWVKVDMVTKSGTSSTVKQLDELELGQVIDDRWQIRKGTHE